jgi:AAA+ ATPase superfamily predicted ATPase
MRRPTFVDRQSEIEQLDDLARHHGLVVLFGRRRIGKTSLLQRWLRRWRGLYSQAVEGSVSLQLAQTYLDLAERLEPAIEPRSWPELFALLDAQRGPLVLCLDEFPYLVASEPALPSMLQKWLDHRRKEDVLIVLAGSSTRMMHATFLEESAPLYGRALKTIRLGPMAYRHFCRFHGVAVGTPSFELFALTGGVPKYWQWLAVASASRRTDPLELADRLFFAAFAWMDEEPRRVLADERLSGIAPVSVLEAIGRGAHRPSEIAGRLGTPQTSLSKLFQALLDASLVVRDIPFGSSARDPKRTLYRIADPALRFWYTVYSPHRSRWPTYDRATRATLFAAHCGAVFEDWVRSAHPGSGRYWDSSVELDMVREERRKGGARRLVVSEIKWKTLSANELRRVKRDLAARFARSALAKRYHDVELEVIDARALARLARRER